MTQFSLVIELTTTTMMKFDQYNKDHIDLGYEKSKLNLTESTTFENDLEVNEIHLEDSDKLWVVTHSKRLN